MVKLFQVLLVAGLLLANSLTYADEIIVDIGGSGDFTSIQAAIDDVETVDGDVVIVLEGTYYENIKMPNKAITLRSTNPQDPAVVTSTVIDGNDLDTVIACHRGQDPNTIISGFVITKGYGDYDGGGMYIFDSSPTVTHCTFSNNEAGRAGGGIFNMSSSPSIINCTFSGNKAGGGGGMYNVSSSPFVKNCIFSGNMGVGGFSQMYAGRGGGMANEDSSPTVINCKFSGNSITYFGGGMSNGNASPTVIDCMFDGNTAGTSGGGMYNGSWQNDPSSPTINNCTFSGNTAGFDNTGFGTSGGGGIFNTSSSPSINSCIFSGNMADEGIDIYITESVSSQVISNCEFRGTSMESGGSLLFVDSHSYPQFPTLLNSYVCSNVPFTYFNELHGASEGNNMQFCPPPSPVIPEVEGDLTGDGKVDMADLAVLAINWLAGVKNG